MGRGFGAGGLETLWRERWWDADGNVRVARAWPGRLLGLAFVREPPGCSLLLPRTRSVHTFGMRFELDLVWLDAEGRAVRVDRKVPPRRIRTCRRARSVLELSSSR